jgi:CheY-like chemotaxis protein
VAECANGFEAVKAIAELAPDLVFLDIQMPRLDGFEVVELAGASGSRASACPTWKASSMQALSCACTAPSSCA